MASSFDNVLSEITDESVKQAKQQLQDLLEQAKGDSSEFARQNAALLEGAIVDLRNGEIDEEDFNLFIEEQRAAAEQFLNTQAIGGQARARELTFTILDIAAKKIAPAVIAAI